MLSCGEKSFKMTFELLVKYEVARAVREMHCNCLDILVKWRIVRPYVVDIITDCF